VSTDAVAAPDVIEPIAGGVPAGGITLAFQTIVRDYLDPASNQAYEGAMRGWLATMPRGSALWVELEIDHREPSAERPTVLLAHVPDGNGGVVDLPLAHTNYHPKDLAVNGDAARELGALTARG
jgi:hypothetical protein